MSRLPKIILLVGIALVALFLAPNDLGSTEAEALFAPVPVEDLVTAAAALFASLIGIPSFLAAALALLEYFGKITPGLSDTIQMYANTILYVAAFIAVLFGKTSLLSMIDHYLGGIAPALVALLVLLSGGIHSIIQTRRYSVYIRTLHPVRLKATFRSGD